jgi:hypothetical protein
MQQMIKFYNQKYIDGSEFMVIKSLNYFDDAEKEELPIMFKNIDWQTIKTTILNS